MRSILIILFFILIIVSAKSYGQKWLPGHYTDVKGNMETGLIRFGSKKNGPVKGEGFIEFKKDDKDQVSLFTAGFLKSFVVVRDSFVVAHAPGNETWANNELDFIRVVLNEDVKLYAAGGVKTGGGHAVSVVPEVGAGISTGTYGSGVGVGGGIDVIIGGGGDIYENLVYYYGDNTADMKRLNDKNFEDIMCDMMGDYPEVVDKIKAKVYVLENIDKLIAYFKKVSSGQSMVNSQ